MRIQSVLLTLASLSGGCGSSNSVSGFSAAPSGGGTLTPYQLLKQDILIEADCWDARPKMIAAGLGFTSIIGVPGLDVTPQGVASTYGVPVVNCDGLPVEFSWPILPSTLDATDFRVNLNDGTWAGQSALPGGALQRSQSAAHGGGVDGSGQSPHGHQHRPLGLAAPTVTAVAGSTGQAKRVSGAMAAATA